MRRAPVGSGQLSLLDECLSGQDRAVLSFARDHHLQGRLGPNVQLVLGITESRYYQQLVRLIDRPEAAQAEPDLIARLHELRDRRRKLRGGVG